MRDMSKQRLTDSLEKSRMVLNACLEELYNSPMDKESLQEGLDMVRLLLQYAENELNDAEKPVYSDEDEALYTRSVKLVVEEQKASTALLQRRLSIGYGRAAKMLDMMTEREIVSPGANNGLGRRKVLMQELPKDSPGIF